MLGSGALGRLADERARRDPGMVLVANDGVPTVGQSKRETAYLRIVKPIAERVLGGLLLLVMAPVLIVIMGLIRATLGPGVVYRQRRVGKDNRVFTMYKLRTMAPDRRRSRQPHQGRDRRVNHKCDADPRHTRLGRTLRKWSLDESPQLWNVVVGDMSLVGPRPELVDVVMKYDFWDHPRNLVKPGITGLWQISRHRGGLLHENLEYDEVYVSHTGLWTDIKILLGTPRAVLQRRGCDRN
jgi:lipopolysaccharide/colanic/teichoic acid biosynthesis glycosyltransferase